MSAAIKVKVGAALELRLGLDGQNDNTAVVVKCTLRDSANVQIGSVLTLTHVGEGVFKDSSQVMPDTPVVTARYIIYQGDGTTLHLDHQSALDLYVKDTQVADIWSEALPGAYGSGQAGKLVGDNLDAAVSSRESESSASTRASTDQSEHDTTQAAIAALNNLDSTDVQTAVQSGLTIQGYTTSRAPNLDNLDVAVSSRESEASASSRATTDQTEHDATQAAIAALPVPPSVSAIADGVWDEALAGHLTSGSTGEALDLANTVLEAAAIADAVWDAQRADHIDAGSFGEVLQNQSPIAEPLTARLEADEEFTASLEETT